MTFDVAVAVCTFRRNGPLKVVLAGIDRALTTLEATTGKRGAVVVSDDNPHGEAEPVVSEFRAASGRHVEYRHVGGKNISLNRNTAIETGFAIAEFVALIDDDGEPFDDWLVQSFAVQTEFDADIVTGTFEHKVPDYAPAWLTKSPVLDEGSKYPDRSIPPFGLTGNTMLKSQWFLTSGVRFDEALGISGGEDMVFFDAAVRQGAHHRYALHSVVWETLPPERCTFRYQLYCWTWFGNTEAVTNREAGTATRLRLVLRAGKRVLTETVALAHRVAGPQPTGVRMWATRMGWAFGLVVGAAGYRMPHK
jgi:succinoglycan biosynthesis protein ExoM